MFHRLLNTETTGSFSSEKAVFIDLLNLSLERRLRKKPELLKAMVEEQPGKTVIIDEIQKAPDLLDVVHCMLSDRAKRFILTGPSARKLKRGSANLLAGRASVKELFPLASIEWGEAFSLEHALNWGSLPEIVTIEREEEKRDFLSAYAKTYLREEIAAEQLVRKVDAFRGFLEVGAQAG